LGAFGALIINHTSVINNTASFGGGIACDSCRAILAAQIDSNKAIRNVSLDNSPTPSSVLWAASSGSNGGSSGGCRNGTSSGSSLNPARRLRHAVLGAGGGIAANLAGNSYVVVCVSGNGTSLDDRGRSTLRHNTAQALGGAVYLNSTQIAADCPFPQPGPALTETCFPGGWWPKKCGFNTLDLDWQGSLASAGGDLVAWAGDTSGFNMACTLTGAACSNSTLQEAGNATSGRAGGRGSSSSGRVNEQGVWVKQGSSSGGARSSNSSSGSSGSQQTCVRTFDAQAPYVCAAGSGLTGKNVMLVDETRKFQLPASFYVYVSVEDLQQ
jgi:predicted outer membrane repeat protein